jgi:hypothetical protein
VSIRFGENLVKNAVETLVMSRLAFWEESRPVHRKSKLTETEKCNTGEEQSQDYAYNFL